LGRLDTNEKIAVTTQTEIYRQRLCSGLKNLSRGTSGEQRPDFGNDRSDGCIIHFEVKLTHRLLVHGRHPRVVPYFEGLNCCDGFSAHLCEYLGVLCGFRS
jgi:hypothetical protein